jgi:hypothetical protein
MEPRIRPDEWQDFFERNFCNREQRRNILLHWHGLKWAEDERVARVFERFMTAILCETMAFRLRSDSFLLFGDRYPVRFEWIDLESQRFCARLFHSRTSAFAQCKEYADRRVDCYEPCVTETDVFPDLWRQQIVRDFIHIVHGLRNDNLALELIAALQAMLCKYGNSKHGHFLRSLVGSLQGDCDVREVMCIE